jgi:ankyrin repeat protein
VDIDEKNSYGKSALDIAVESNAKKIAAYLSGTLADDSPASVAAGGMTLQQAAKKGDVEAIKAIAGTGADINGVGDGTVQNFDGCTALAVAVAHLQADAVEALLSCGADPSFKDGNGRAAASFFFSPHLSASVDEKRTKKIVKDLISAGMSINLAVNDSSDTLLILACRSSRGTMSNDHCVKIDVIDETLKHDPDVNLANRFGETAMMHICARDFEVVENIQISLLEQGADVSAADRNGDTALHYAARNSDKKAAKSLCDMLLEFGANANAVNNAKKTALDIATEQNNEPLVKLLLSKM